MGTYKYLEVWYVCKQVTPKVKRACEIYNGAKNLALECPSGSTVKIVSANYGRTNSGYCQRYNHQKDTCASKQPDTNQKVNSQCNNKQKCNVSASNAVFGDPCPGIYKYLEVWYLCE